VTTQSGAWNADFCFFRLNFRVVPISDYPSLAVLLPSDCLSAIAHEHGLASWTGYPDIARGGRTSSCLKISVQKSRHSYPPSDGGKCVGKK
jgi:hypothetical protein